MTSLVAEYADAGNIVAAPSELARDIAATTPPAATELDVRVRVPQPDPRTAHAEPIHT